MSSADKHVIFQTMLFQFTKYMVCDKHAIPIGRYNMHGLFLALNRYVSLFLFKNVYSLYMVKSKYTQINWKRNIKNLIIILMCYLNPKSLFFD